MEATTIGRALKRRRSDLGIDQMGAAARIGMSRTSYSSYERDLQRPSADVLPALAKFLEVSMEGVLTLYGATCIEAMRPALNHYLAAHDIAETNTAPKETIPPAPREGIAPTDTSGTAPSNRRDEPTELSVSIFANELSDSDAPSAIEPIAISRVGENASAVERPSSAPKKKKKKKKGNKK